MFVVVAHNFLGKFQYVHKQKAVLAGDRLVLKGQYVKCNTHGGASCYRYSL